MRGLHMYRTFQSTLPVRGATHLVASYYQTGQISIHAPREGSDSGFAYPVCQETISIHAPREGSDNRGCKDYRKNRISIHAPREGSDSSINLFLLFFEYFNPRSP